jgi:hypothetical protein
MLEKDYFMRLIHTLMEALQKIKNNIDNNKVESAKDQLLRCYEILGESSDFFTNSAIDDIITFFKTNNGNYLKRVEILAELLFLEAKIQNNTDNKKTLLLKSQSLFKYHSSNSKEYSFEVQTKLSQLKTKLT